MATIGYSASAWFSYLLNLGLPLYQILSF